VEGFFYLPYLAHIQFYKINKLARIGVGGLTLALLVLGIFGILSFVATTNGIIKMY